MASQPWPPKRVTAYSLMVQPQERAADRQETRDLYDSLEGLFRDTLSQSAKIPGAQSRMSGPTEFGSDLESEVRRLYGLEPTTVPTRGLGSAIPTVWPAATLERQRAATRDPGDPNESFYDRSWEWAQGAAKGIVASFNPLEAGISRRERLFRTANLASLTVPVGWLAKAGQLAVTLPAFRAMMMTAKGRVAMHALEGSLMSVATEAIRKPEDREVGLWLSGLSGGILGAAVGKLVDTGMVRHNRRATQAILGRLINQESVQGALLRDKWAVIPYESLIKTPEHVPKGNARRLLGHLQDTGYSHVEVALSDGRKGTMVAGLSDYQAVQLGRELGIDEVITSRGLIQTQSGMIAPAQGYRSTVGLDIPEGSWYVSIPQAAEGADPVRFSAVFATDKPVQLGARLPSSHNDVWAETAAMIDWSGTTKVTSLWARYAPLDTREVAGRWYSQWVNRLYGAGVLDEAFTGLKVDDLHVVDSVAKTLQVEKSAWAGRLMSAVRHRVVDPDNPGLVTDRSLFDILKTLRPDEMDEFQAYGLSAMWVHLEEAGAKIPAHVAQNIGRYREAVSKAPKHWQETLIELSRWRTDRAHDTLVRSGIISEGQWKAFRGAHPISIPLVRTNELVGQDQLLGPAAAARAIADYDPIKYLAKELKPEEQWAPWLEELVRETGTRYRMAGQQKTINMIDERIREFPEFMAQFAVPVDPPRALTQYESGGLPGLMTIQDKTQGGGTFIRATRQVQREMGEDAVTVPQWYRMSDTAEGANLWDAMTNLTPSEMDMVVRVMSAPATLLRTGVTAGFDFLLKNVIRDMGFSFIRGGGNMLTHPLVFLNGLASVWNKDEWYKGWLASGGARAALSSMDRPYLAGVVKEASHGGQSATKTALQAVKNPIQVMVAMSEILENATRVGHFRQYLTKIGPDAVGNGADRLEGMAQYTGKTLLDAAHSAREISVDFSVAGANKWMQSFRSMTPFLGAAVAGTDQLARAWVREPGKLTARAFKAITLPSLTFYAINRRDEEYTKGIPTWEKNLFWHLARPGVAPGDPGRWLRIPKPFEPGMLFGSLPERMMEAIDEEEPGALDGIMNQLLFDVMGSYVPQPTVAMPLLEIARNKSAFTGAPIVPRGLEEVDESFVANPQTSEFAKNLARWINGGVVEQFGLDPERRVTPLEIDHLVRGYTGGLGKTMIGDLGDLMVAGYRAAAGPDQDAFWLDQKKPAGGLETSLVGALVSRFPYSSQANEDFWQVADRVRTASGTVSYLEDTLQVEDLLDWSLARANLMGLQGTTAMVAQEMAKIRNAKGQILVAPGMDPEAKREAIRQLDVASFQMVTTVNAALARLGAKPR